MSTLSMATPNEVQHMFNMSDCGAKAAQKRHRNLEKESSDEALAKSTCLGLGDQYNLLSTSLIAKAAAESSISSCSSNRTKEKPKDSMEEQKKKRLEANRRSAAESRRRKKELLVDLQTSIKNLEEENEVLEQENQAMRSYCDSVLPMSCENISQLLASNHYAGASNQTFPFGQTFQNAPFPPILFDNDALTSQQGLSLSLINTAIPHVAHATNGHVSAHASSESLAAQMNSFLLSQSSDQHNEIVNSIIHKCTAENDKREQHDLS